MRILSLDTTTPGGSVALAGAGRLIEQAPLDRTQPVATRLPGDLAALLARHGVALSSIDVYAVATGPGSFTGLRIGIATMQGLALAHGKPLVGIPTFEALATLAPAARVAVWIDAWRGEVYGATYSRQAATDDVTLRALDEPSVGPPDVLLANAAASELGETLFVGDGALRYRDRLPRVYEPTPLAAGVIATLADARARAGELPPPHAIRPLYVRRPDAEMARDRAAAGGRAR